MSDIITKVVRNPNDVQPVVEKGETLEKIVVKEVVAVKPGIFKRIARILFGDRGLKGVMSDVGKDVISPALKDMFYDALTNGSRRIIYGENTPVVHRNSSNSVKTTTTNYRDISNKYTSQPISRVNSRPSLYVTDYAIETKEKAIEVIEALKDYIYKYNLVSVGEYYDLIGVSTSWTDRNYGWRDLSSVTIIRVPDGFVINFPPLEEVRR